MIEHVALYNKLGSSKPGIALQGIGLSKSFGHLRAVSDFSFSVKSGSITALIGPNGAGKTSLFNLVSGVVPLDAGAVYLNGKPVHHMPLHRRARAGIARTWQTMRLFQSMTVLDNLLVGARESSGEHVLAIVFKPSSVRRADEALRARATDILGRMGLSALAGKYVTDLPFGQQKLVGLARALMNDGPCLRLDEPMAGVEGQSYLTMQRVVREEAQRGRAVCVVEHNITFIRDLCTVAVFMSNGRILQRGTVAELLASEELAELYFGT